MNLQALIDPTKIAFELELLNGQGLITEIVFLICIFFYLKTELKERNLTFRDWMYIRLPHHINFAVAVAFADAGVCIRDGAIWFWRRFLGGAEMPVWLFIILAVGILFIIIGSLCKIRELSYPILIGRMAYVRPWLVTVLALFFFVTASVYFR